jgi:transcriptional regulator with XRE-family HTH domain
MKFVVEDNPAEEPEARAGQLIRELRLARGLSQVDLAQRLAERGLSWHQTTVAKTERADRPLRVNELAALAKVLGVSVGDLLNPQRIDLPQEAALAQQYLAAAEQNYTTCQAVQLDLVAAHGKALGRAEELKAALEANQAKIETAKVDLDRARQHFQAVVAAGGATARG